MSHSNTGATRVVPRLKMIGWLTWSWYSEFILSRNPSCCLQNRKGLVVCTPALSPYLSPNDYTRGDYPARVVISLTRQVAM
jgi:hypothetical protein